MMSCTWIKSTFMVKSTYALEFDNATLQFELNMDQGHKTELM